MPLQITKTKPKAPPCILLYGQPGVGKTTLAASLPDAVFLPVEDGTGSLEVDALPTPRTWDEIMTAIRSLATEPHPYRVLVIDTIDAAEALLFRDITRGARVDSIEEVGGGYGKGYTAAVEAWHAMCNAIADLNARRGMVTVLLGHSTVATYKNPEGPDYDRYTLKMHAKSAAVIVGFASVVLFAGYQDTVQLNKADARRADAAMKRGKIQTSGERILRTKRTGACDAKTRYTMPDEIPLSAAALIRYIPGLGTQRPDDWIQPYTEELSARLAALGVEVADPLGAIRAAFAAKGAEFDKIGHTRRMQALDKITEGSELLAAMIGAFAGPVEAAPVGPDPVVEPPQEQQRPPPRRTPPGAEGKRPTPAPPREHTPSPADDGDDGMS